MEPLGEGLFLTRAPAHEFNIGTHVFYPLRADISNSIQNFMNDKKSYRRLRDELIPKTRPNLASHRARMISCSEKV